MTSDEQPFSLEKQKNKKRDALTVTPEQLRAARALLDWSRTQCAKAVGLSAETIKNIEHDIFVPTQDTIEKIISGFSCHGVEFFTQHGVSLKDTRVRVASNFHKEPDSTFAE